MCFLLSCNFLIFWFSISSSFVFCVLASRDELQSRKVKLDYDEVGICQKDAINIWDKKLLNCRAKIRCDMEDIHSTLKEGIYVGELLALKSQDHIFCSLLIPTEIGNTFSSSKKLPSFHKGAAFCRTQNRFFCACELQCQQCRNMCSPTPESSILFLCVIAFKIELGASAANT